MKKIPTLFERVFEKRGKRSIVVGINPTIYPGCEGAFLHGDATIKIDGACCAVINGLFYKRYDAKKGRTPPAGAIPCCEADPITGHHPHWVAVDRNNPDDKWFIRAADNTPFQLFDGTYEAIGTHFNGNPYGLCDDILEPHGVKKVEVERTFESIRAYLEANNVEGLVFWLNGEPVCKIKRTDFGLAWPMIADGEESGKE